MYDVRRNAPTHATRTPSGAVALPFRFNGTPPRNTTGAADIAVADALDLHMRDEITIHQPAEARAKGTKTARAKFSSHPIQQL
jgi:hypothetical protein